MAKRVGDPDSVTSQWFVNLGDNLELDTQNEGFTVFGEVLGRGMKVVDQLASSEIYNFGALFGELPLWDLKRNDGSSVVVAPDDFLIINSARKLKTKKQPFILNVESSDESVVSAHVMKNQRIKLKASGAASGIAEISVEAISLVDGTVDVDRFDVVIGGALRRERSIPRSARKGSKRIDIFVDGGSFEDPFYRFYDLEGDELEGLRFNVKNKYRFYRMGGVKSHPFYVGDSGYNAISSKALKIKGDGSFFDGITGSKMLTVSVRKSYRKEFKKKGELSYFCTEHPSMIGSFAIKGRQDVAALAAQDTTTDETVITDSIANSSGNYYRVAIDATDQLPLL